MDLDGQTLSRAKQQAYRSLAYRSHTAHELRARLERRGHAAAIIDEVLRQLEDEGYVDDRKLARDWAYYRLQSKPVGRRRLAWELQRRGISRELSQEIIREIYTACDELALAEQAARKHLGARQLPHSSRERQRFARYLVGLGFERDTIATVLSSILEVDIPPEIASDCDPDYPC
jgi:regulatory protein